jgi:hypothetical protein
MPCLLTHTDCMDPPSLSPPPFTHTPDLVDNHHFEKSLRLVISFGSLKRAQFVNALEERLKPALDKVCGWQLGGLCHLLRVT